jgi:hypothetical protein
MKITLTYSELSALVRNVYNLPDNTELEISEYSGMDHPVSIRLMEALKQEGCFTPTNGIRLDKKIAAIKLLRDLVVDDGVNTNGQICGLAQAKWAIEDWDKFILYVRRHGYPPMGGNDPERGWLK